MTAVSHFRHFGDATVMSAKPPGFGHRLKQMDVADVPGPAVSSCSKSSTLLAPNSVADE
jgi:hypothetical protein